MIYEKYLENLVAKTRTTFRNTSLRYNSSRISDERLDKAYRDYHDARKELEDYRKFLRSK